jgi:copper chaperone CopZ
MILENALGNKKNDVYRKLKSINGVSEVTINVKPFSTIPKDKERVTVTIELAK